VCHSIQEEDDAENEQQVIITRDHVLGAEVCEGSTCAPVLRATNSASLPPIPCASAPTHTSAASSVRREYADRHRDSGSVDLHTRIVAGLARKRPMQDIVTPTLDWILLESSGKALSAACEKKVTCVQSCAHRSGRGPACLNFGAKHTRMDVHGPGHQADRRGNNRPDEEDVTSPFPRAIYNIFDGQNKVA